MFKGITVAGRWRWRKARNLTDLANVQADRIARNLPDGGRMSRFAYLTGDGAVRFGPPQTEIGHAQQAMYRALVALGRAGMVVVDWRPGVVVSDGDVTLDTRACVFGFASEEVKNRLDNLLYYAGKESDATQYELGSVIELYAPGCIEYDRHDGAAGGRWRGHWVERIDGGVTARVGAQMDARQVYQAFPTRRSVQRELRQAWQITVVSPAWGDGAAVNNNLVRLLNGDLSRGAETAA